MLEQAGVNMILNGHTHDYQMGVLNGVYHVISGGGGGALEDKHCFTFPWVQKEIFAYNFLSVDVGCDEMTVRAIDITGAELDKFSIPASPLQ
jgi:hypothetical protein